MNYFIATIGIVGGICSLILSFTLPRREVIVATKGQRSELGAARRKFIASLVFGAAMAVCLSLSWDSISHYLPRPAPFVAVPSGTPAERPTADPSFEVSPSDSSSPRLFPREPLPTGWVSGIDSDGYLAWVATTPTCTRSAALEFELPAEFSGYSLNASIENEVSGEVSVWSGFGDEQSRHQLEDGQVTLLASVLGNRTPPLHDEPFFVSVEYRGDTCNSSDTAEVAITYVTASR